MLGRLEEITVEHWEKAFRTNVVGLHQCALRALNLMKRRGRRKDRHPFFARSPRLRGLFRLHGEPLKPPSNR